MESVYARGFTENTDGSAGRPATPDLSAGDMAYNFCSPLYDFSDGRENVTEEQFDLLAAAREKPVALIFGSYT